MSERRPTVPISNKSSITGYGGADGQNFPHFHVASAYSAHYGVTMPEVLIDQGATGTDFLALTDRDGLYGAVKHVRRARPPGSDQASAQNWPSTMTSTGRSAG